MTMPRMIHLASLADMPAPASRFDSALMQQGRAALVKAGLRYDTARDMVFDNSGWLERPSRADDRTQYASLGEVMEWVFSRYINNAASRLSRGYSAH